MKIIHNDFRRIIKNKPNIRDLIADFLWNLREFQKDTIDPEINRLCDGITSDLDCMDERIRRQERPEDDFK